MFARVTAAIAQAMMPLLVHSTHGSTFFPEVSSNRAPNAQVQPRQGRRLEPVVGPQSHRRTRLLYSV